MHLVKAMFMTLVLHILALGTWYSRLLLIDMAVLQRTARKNVVSTLKNLLGTPGFASHLRNFCTGTC